MSVISLLLSKLESVAPKFESKVLTESTLVTLQNSLEYNPKTGVFTNKLPSGKKGLQPAGKVKKVTPAYDKDKIRIAAMVVGFDNISYSANRLAMLLMNPKDLDKYNDGNWVVTPKDGDVTNLKYSNLEWMTKSNSTLANAINKSSIKDSNLPRGIFLRSKTQGTKTNTYYQPEIAINKVKRYGTPSKTIDEAKIELNKLVDLLLSENTELPERTRDALLIYKS